MKIRDLFKKIGMTAADYAKTKDISTQSAHGLLNSKKVVVTDSVIRDLKEKIKDGVYVMHEPQKILNINNGQVEFDKKTSKVGRPKSK